MMKTQNGHNLSNFEATTSRLCMVIDLNDTYKMMMTMTMIKMMMMKTQNGHSQRDQGHGLMYRGLDDQVGTPIEKATVFKVSGKFSTSL